MAARGNRKSSTKYAARAGYTSKSPRWSSSGHHGGARPHARRHDRPGDPEQRYAVPPDVAAEQVDKHGHRCAHCAQPVGASRAKRLDGYEGRFHGGCTKRALRYAVRRYGADAKAVRAATAQPWTAADLADLAEKAEA